MSSPLTLLRFAGSTGKFTWRMLATVLGGQTLVFLLGGMVGRGTAIADGDPDRARTILIVSGVLAVFSLVAARMVKGRFGLTLGWLVQLFTLASGFVVPMMFVIGLVFLALWVVCLVQGQRIDEIQAGFARQREAEEAEEEAAEAGTGGAEGTEPSGGDDTHESTDGPDRVSP